MQSLLWDLTKPGKSGWSDIQGNLSNLETVGIRIHSHKQKSDAKWLQMHSRGFFYFVSFAFSNSFWLSEIIST